MSVTKIDFADVPSRQAPIEGGPSVKPLVGVGDGWSVGAVEVTVPAGGGMPNHAHGPSATTFIPLEGEVHLVADGTAHVMTPGTLATIPVGDEVAVENRGDAPVRILVVFDPPDFAAGLASWPEA